MEHLDSWANSACYIEVEAWYEREIWDMSLICMEKKLKKYLKNGKFDNVSEVRSKTMSAIRGKNNRTTEIKLKMALIRDGVGGFKLHAKEVPGTPDFYFEKEKLVSCQVDSVGCFACHSGNLLSRNPELPYHGFPINKSRE